MSLVLEYRPDSLHVSITNFLSSNLVYYRINSCPNNCSGHGKCTTSTSIPSQVYCECDKYWKGEACDIPYCKANCGSPDHGYCDLTGEKLCVCNDSWQGELTRSIPPPAPPKKLLSYSWLFKHHMNFNLKILIVYQ